MFYPFFGTLPGWRSVALSRSDTASSVQFSGLQHITSEQLGLSPYLMSAANSAGGVRAWTGVDSVSVQFCFLNRVQDAINMH